MTCTNCRPTVCNVNKRNKKKEQKEGKKTGIFSPCVSTQRNFILFDGERERERERFLVLDDERRVHAMLRILPFILWPVPDLRRGTK